MNRMIATILGFVLTGAAYAADSAITPQMQTQLDAQKKIIALWAADPALVDAVKAQNLKGPLPGMDEAAWKALESRNPAVKTLRKGSIGIWLNQKMKASDGLYTEAFLSGAKGEKVAFAQKPTSYNHAGNPKFDVPMSGKEWQGVPELDASTKTEQIQIGVPVIDGGAPIGVLVVGLSVKKLTTETATP